MKVTRRHGPTHFCYMLIDATVQMAEHDIIRCQACDNSLLLREVDVTSVPRSCCFCINSLLLREAVDANTTAARHMSTRSKSCKTGRCSWSPTKADAQTSCWQKWHHHLRKADAYEEFLGKHLCGSTGIPFRPNMSTLPSCNGVKQWCNELASTNNQHCTKATWI